jgi:hypothetical protein
VKKLALLAGGVGAAVAMAVIGSAQASADAPDVTGEMYGKAVAILRSQGYSAVFGGAIGDDLQQSQCLVSDQEPMSNGKQRLRLDCNLQPGQEKPGAPNTHSLVPPGGSVPGGETGARPTPGAGTVTVTPVPVG